MLKALQTTREKTSVACSKKEKTSVLVWFDLVDFLTRKYATKNTTIIYVFCSPKGTNKYNNL